MFIMFMDQIPYTKNENGINGTLMEINGKRYENSTSQNSFVKNELFYNYKK